MRIEKAIEEPYKGDIVALTSVDKKRIIYIYRVDSTHKESTNRIKLRWKYNISSVYEVEHRRYSKAIELYAGNKRVISNDQIPVELIEEFLKHESKEMLLYNQNVKSIVDRAMEDLSSGRIPSLFLKYGQTHYYLEEKVNGRSSREEITGFNSTYELIMDLTKLGYLQGDSMISYESRNYDFKYPNEEYYEDINVDREMFKLLNYR